MSKKVTKLCVFEENFCVCSFIFRLNYYTIIFYIQERTVLEAETVYLLMKKGFPISRNVRAQWLLEHLDSVISIQYPNAKSKEEPELEIVSVLPKDKPAAWSIDTSYQFFYKVVTTTSIIFLAHKYRMVFNLDLSPSLATVVSNCY